MSNDTAIKGMVLHCDGGARPNPGFGGYGIHGYVYQTIAPNKGTGRNFVISSQGYLERNSADAVATPAGNQTDLDTLLSLKPVAVSAVTYVDITGSISGTSTNNTCEIVAMTKAFEYAMRHNDIQFLQIFTDSEYTKKGINEWVDFWDNNNWYKSDGNIVANQDLWKLLKSARDAALSKGLKFNVEWIRGHDGAIGNEKADMLASIGVFDAQRGIIGETVQETEAEGYWKSTVNRHPFIAHRRCYFSSQSAFVPGVYHLGDHGKDDELLGKRASDGCYSVVQLEEPDSVLELLRRHQANLSGSSDSIFAMHLDQIYGVDQYKTLDLFGERSVSPPNGYRLDLKHADKTPLTREFKPARLAARSIDELENLEILLDRFSNNSQDITIHEITDFIYDFTEKKHPPKKGQKEGIVEIISKLKPEIVVGLTHLTVKAKTPFDDVQSLEDIKLTFGIDILNRNSLKRLEGMNPHVYVITWAVSDCAYRYATVIKANGSVGIWCGVYSNLKLVTTKTTNSEKQEEKK